ncbi:hypothetical protein E3N88_08511 [Mikania micrantha]|uniref:type I protein arginine methyltransferase n=1 Tax=Mikania micrantha TaxID=192012 RepID=A0A5N6PJI0_9ASTR|nr:hypothetical protein E3N88_08511 [Mikania micrantha]
MDATLPAENLKPHQNFTVASISLLASNPPKLVSGPLSAIFGSRSGFPELQFFLEPDGQHSLNFDLRTAQLFRLGEFQSLCVSEGSESIKEWQITIAPLNQRTYSKGVTIQFKEEEESSSFHGAFEQWRKKVVIQESTLPNGTASSFKSKFDDKIEASSAKMYFHYYGQLLHQQNMLQDYVRTGSYYAAVIENQADFDGRVVLMLVLEVAYCHCLLPRLVQNMFMLWKHLKWLTMLKSLLRGTFFGTKNYGDCPFFVIKGKVEDVELPEKADILISEPMGTLLVNERMLESYVIARDRFLVPNGKMFPTVGSLHMLVFLSLPFYQKILCASDIEEFTWHHFSDEYLYVEIANKV